VAQEQRPVVPAREVGQVQELKPVVLAREVGQVQARKPVVAAWEVRLVQAQASASGAVALLWRLRQVSRLPVCAALKLTLRMQG